MTFPLVFLGILAVVAGFVILHGVGKALGFPGGITEFVFLRRARALPHRMGACRAPPADRWRRHLRRRLDLLGQQH